MGSRNAVDRFNKLPEEIRSHIFSLMPTKFVVQTSILSKTWRYNWRLITKLDLDERCILPRHRNGFLIFMDRVLNFYKTSPLESLRLFFRNFKVPKLCLSNLINEAVRLNVCELDVNAKLIDFPLSMFTCKTLTSLKLDRSYDDGTIWEVPCSVNLPCLKRLDISVCSNPFANAFKLIYGCPMLESLSLKIRRCDDGKDYIFNIPTLRRLKLTLLICASTTMKVVLNVPNLEYLFVGGELFSFFVMKDVSSLVEASLSLTETRSHHLWAQLLNGLSGVKSLSVEEVKFFNFTLELLSASPLPIFPNMKQLKLEFKCYQPYSLIVQFLESCPNLEHMWMIEPDATSWIEPKSVPACMLTSFTTLEFSSYRDDKCDLKFLEYMLGNGEVLKTVTITCDDLMEEEYLPLCIKLLKLPRASRHCRVDIFNGYGFNGHHF